MLPAEIAAIPRSTFSPEPWLGLATTLQPDAHEGVLVAVAVLVRVWVIVGVGVEVGGVPVGVGGTGVGVTQLSVYISTSVRPACAPLWLPAPHTRLWAGAATAK